eukprot:1993659-Rhodomonas_salina.1
MLTRIGVLKSRLPNASITLGQRASTHATRCHSNSRVDCPAWISLIRHRIHLSLIKNRFRLERHHDDVEHRDQLPGTGLGGCSAADLTSLCRQRRRQQSPDPRADISVAGIRQCLSEALTRARVFRTWVASDGEEVGEDSRALLRGTARLAARTQDLAVVRRRSKPADHRDAQIMRAEQAAALATRAPFSQTRQFKPAGTPDCDRAVVRDRGGMEGRVEGCDDRA